MPTPGVPDAAPKSSNRGCLIALGVFFGVCLLIVVVAGAFAYKLAKSEKGQAVIGLVGGAGKLVGQAATAPGTAELRALGCEQAMVMDLAEFGKLGEAFADLDKGKAKKPRPPLGGLMVACHLQVFSPGLTCEQVAATYSKVQGRPPGPFTVMVQRQGQRKPDCTKAFGDAAAVPAPELPPEAPTP